jgi:hypothetical protein
MVWKKEGNGMDTYLEVKGDGRTFHVSVNGADLVVDGNHPLYVELRLLIDHTIQSASRNTRKGVVGTLTLDDLIHSTRERLQQLEKYQKQQAGD